MKDEKESEISVFDSFFMGNIFGGVALSE